MRHEDDGRWCVTLFDPWTVCPNEENGWLRKVYLTSWVEALALAERMANVQRRLRLAHVERLTEMDRLHDEMDRAVLDATTRRDSFAVSATR